MSMKWNNYNNIIRKLQRFINNNINLKGGYYGFFTQDNVRWPRIIGGIVILILIIVLIYFILRASLSKVESGDCSGTRGCLLLSEVKNGNKSYKIPSGNFPISNPGLGYTMSVWLYVKSDNFDRKIQKFKSILYRGQSKVHNGFLDKQFTVQPGIWLFGNTNKILLRWNTEGRVCNLVNCKEMSQPCNPGKRCRKDDNTILYCQRNKQLVDENIGIHSMNPYINPPNKLCSGQVNETEVMWNTSDSNLDNETCIDNIPLDRWFQLTIVMHNQSIDIYLDGKLYSTFVLNSLPSSGANSNLTISTDNSPFYRNLNGFEGAVTQLRYFNYPLNPHQVTGIYSWGPHPYVHENTNLGKKKINQDSSSNNSNNEDDKNYLGSDNY